MEKKQTAILEELRKLLKHSFKPPEDEATIRRVRGLLLNESNNPDTNPHVRLLAAHVLWHLILNCNYNFIEIFPREQFSFVNSENGSYLCISTLFDFKQLDFITLCVLNGYINASSDRLCLVASTKVDGENSCRLIDLLELLLTTSIKYKPQDNFFHFTVLKNCLLKFAKISLPLDFMQIYRSIIERLWISCLGVVHSYWDSRYAGVTELVVDMFELFLSFIFRLDKNLVKVDRLIEHYVRDYPYFIRGKYKIVAVLVEFLDFKQFEEVEKCLLSCFRLPMHSTYLSPFAGTVYKTVVSFLAKQDEREKYVKEWIFLTADFLCSPEKDLAFNSAKHFLPAIAKYLSIYYSIFKDNVRLRLDRAEHCSQNVFETIDISNLTSIDVADQNNIASPIPPVAKERPSVERVHWAYAVILKYNLRIKGYCLTEDEKTFLFNGLSARDDELRIECFQTVFDPSTIVGGYFLDHVNMKHFLSNNLTVSDSSFRRRLLTFFKKWLICRVEDNKKRRNFEFENFLKDLLLKLCSNLFPSASYQRVATSLNLIQALFSALPEKSDIAREILSLACSEFVVFLRCIQNSSNDVREVASNVLMVYFQYPLGWKNLHFADEEGCVIYEQLLDTAKNLSNSPKELDCESGATVWKLLFKKYLLELQWSFILKPTFEICDISEQSIEIFCHFLKCQFESLKKNLRDAAINNPLHGYLLAFCTFLQVFNEQKYSLSSSVANTVLTLITVISDHFLNIFGSSRDGECPSLEEMDVAILAECTSRACESLDTDADAIDDALSTDRQLVLACCWLNIKDCATVGAELALCNIESYSDFVTLLTKIGELFFQMMTRTRHWGVLDGCGEALTKFCNFCFSRNDSSVRVIPENILTKILNHMAQPRSVSVTRRAVGYPLMVQCIVVSSCVSKRTNLVARAFENLLNVAQSSFDSTSDGRTDIAVVRAIHCLRLLLRCSSLGQQVSPYVTDCYKLVLKYFSSPVWPLRNSVVLTLSAITWRLFGRRNVLVESAESEISSSVGSATDIATSLCEFRANFDEIWRICYHSIEEIVAKWKSAQSFSFVDSSLYPIFTILQNICLVPDDELTCSETQKSVDNLRRNLLYLLFHLSDSRLRRIAADIFVNFSNSKRIAEKLLSIDNEFAQNGCSMNWLDSLLYLTNSLFFDKKVSLEVDDETSSKTRESFNDLDILSKQTGTVANFPYADCLRLFTYLYRQLKYYDLDTSDLSRNYSQSFRSFLLDCCHRKHGISLQSLALPLFTAFDIDNTTDDRNLNAWAECIHQCSNETRNETCRFSAAYSYTIRGPSPIFAKCTSENDQTNLFFDAVNLLLDEDCEIRDVMCNLFMNDSKSRLCPRTSYLCLQQLFDTVAADSMHLCKSLFDRLNVRTEEFVAMETSFAGNICSTTFLFKQKDFNIFREEFLIVLLSYKAVRRLCLATVDRKILLDRLSGTDNSQMKDSINFGVLSCLRITNDKRFNVCCVESAEKLLIPAFKLRILIDLYNLYETQPDSNIDQFLQMCKKLFCSIFNLDC